VEKDLVDNEHGLHESTNPWFRYPSLEKTVSGIQPVRFAFHNAVLSG